MRVALEPAVGLLHADEDHRRAGDIVDIAKRLGHFGALK